MSGCCRKKRCRDLPLRALPRLTYLPLSPETAPAKPDQFQTEGGRMHLLDNA
ncbi:hypothetical protein M407DRAFT_33675 [Tulasnella calospora MUT 4182]|uniref:Uncharacterized protein n=1 Tax=Tulasnella calospora MUT 4182 TaxID=1051891 RepID=A0A0C3Q1W8_9AGAM|nr:hypothetical protein M407DRAFT_33675 [Tulasnella calospora MUT 4182]